MDGLSVLAGATAAAEAAKPRVTQRIVVPGRRPPRRRPRRLRRRRRRHLTYRIERRSCACPTAPRPATAASTGCPRARSRTAPKSKRPSSLARDPGSPFDDGPAGHAPLRRPRGRAGRRPPGGLRRHGAPDDARGRRRLRGPAAGLVLARPRRHRGPLEAPRRHKRRARLVATAAAGARRAAAVESSRGSAVESSRRSAVGPGPAAAAAERLRVAAGSLAGVTRRPNPLTCLPASPVRRPTRSLYRCCLSTSN